MLAFDHIGLVVADLERSAAIMERLGFTLTARAAHRSEAAGTAVSEQRSVMLRRGYIELQTIADLNGGQIDNTLRIDRGILGHLAHLDDSHREQRRVHGLINSPCCSPNGQR